MAYIVVFLATRWGSELGGLNVFNKGLATGITQALPMGSSVICVVDRLPTNPFLSQESVELLEVENLDVTAIAREISARCNAMESGTLQGALVVGHDVITGQKAIDSTKAIRELVSRDFSVKSAVIAHMDYSAYAFKKHLSLEDVTSRSLNQHKVVEAADCAYAVGPLLQRNFASARSATLRPRSPVRPLIPGADKIRPHSYDRRTDLRIFISGRLNREDDPIKNCMLAAHALAKAYSLGRESNPAVWQARGQLFAWGVDPISDATTTDELKALGRVDAAFESHVEPFSEDQSLLYNRLAGCHLALMPSWHEGFGLSGWEALCAGVPLVCSRQSGLAMFLDDLKNQFPKVSFESVEFLNIGGSSTCEKPTAEDVSHFAEVLLRMTIDLEMRKEAAIDLARFIKREFSWKRCASDLLTGTGWNFPGSVRWPDRQAAARQKDSRQVLERILSDVDRLDLEEDWADLTTAFNELSDAGKGADLLNRQELQSNLRTIGSAIGSRIAISNLTGEIARDTVRMDICWRFMAACSNISESFRDFSQSFSEAMLGIIWEDTFLTKELFYYASAFATEFPYQASEISLAFFSPVQFSSRKDILAKRLARLESKYPDLSRAFPALENDPVFISERARCLQVTQHAHDIAQKIESDPDLASTTLALMALSGKPGRQVADQSVAFFSSYYPDAGRAKGHWRGDKRVFAALATASLSTRAILKVLHSMATDEDESIRWAALHLSFSPTLRRRLESATATGSLLIKGTLNEELGCIVDEAVSTDGGHPWIHREFLNHYLDERAPSVDILNGKRFSVLDFPSARWLIGPVLGEEKKRLLGENHPEVEDTRIIARQVVKRILLVLPPIEIDDEALGASRTSTPALGLGLLASQLAAQGHDVQIADCHRFPKLRTEVLSLARTFDVIGFNVVFSTMKSTMSMLVDIRLRTQTTILVIGGPAAKLDAWRFSTVHMKDAERSWDFTVNGDAVENLSKIVASLTTSGPWPNAPGIFGNRQSLNVLGRGQERLTEKIAGSSTQSSASTWRQATWLRVPLDRRIYRTGAVQYEPANTRATSSGFYEAHVVMSQGCDWDCAFCTERKTRSGGEQRRDVAHIIDELRHLVSEHPALRIQFVDDNLLPQIAVEAKGNSAATYSGLAWATDFFNGLESIRVDIGKSFGWRGIVRLEDFFAYDRHFGEGEFVRKLQRSGCQMLAFGIEHASEEQRRKNKAAKALIENDRIKELFKRLRVADILTKAYFMLGGPWETQQTARDTVDFAIASGATLAYFALYKDFAKATVVLSKEQESNDSKAAGFIGYDQLALNWDEALSAEQDNPPDFDGSLLASGPFTQLELWCYDKLERLGFRFSDLVKYNDFHEANADGGSLLRAVTWNSPVEYFMVIEEAYRRFYLRPDFVEDYAELLAHGY